MNLLSLFILFSLAIGSSTPFEYPDFVPHDENRTCSHDSHTTPFNQQVRGVNLGGWLVLEPWIAPSLFYQFLGAQQRWGDSAPEKTAMDIYTFCTSLGSEEANRQLRIHWKKWVTEEDIIKLQKYGVNSLRIPVGDWMFSPYYPYRNCTDGAVDELKRVIGYAEKYNMTVLLDIHGHRGSQNGFDNSGQSRTVKWTSIASSIPIGTTTFEHWPIRAAEWIGDFDPQNHNYSSINYKNVRHSLHVVYKIAKMFQNNPSVLGIEPINEPWELTPLDLLKEFYWAGYKIVKGVAPHWKYLIHDSFRFGLGVWKGFMAGCPDVALDTHIYQAWMTPGSKEDYYNNACQQSALISKMEQDVMPVIVGEWSLATDNCAMWLNGFNDNIPGFPKVQCQYIECAKSYLGPDFPGQLDRTRPILGPYGTGVSGPSFGQCPVTSNTFFKGMSDQEMFNRLARKKLEAFSVGHGYYFWNFKTELDIKWDFMRAVEAGYLPKDVSQIKNIEQACERENKGSFICRAKRGVPVSHLQSGYKYACSQVNCTGLNVTYPDIYERCDHVFNAFWHKNRMLGSTCDFGGAASLVSPPGVKLPPLPYFDKPMNETEEDNTTISSIPMARSMEHVRRSLEGGYKLQFNIEDIINKEEDSMPTVSRTSWTLVMTTIGGAICGLVVIYTLVKEIRKRRQYMSM